MGEHLKLQISPNKHIIDLEPREEGEELQWTLLHPAKLVQQLVDESPALAEVSGNAANRSAPSQERLWRIVLGFDEFAPGNKLRYNNARKTTVASFTFIELELCHFDDAWFTPVVVRTSIINRCRGGWSHMAKLFLTLLLLGPEGMATTGLPLLLFGEYLLIFAKRR